LPNSIKIPIVETYIILQHFMSTRTKYNRIGGEQTTVQDKADTDIIMRFSPSYGNNIVIQVNTFLEL